MRIATWNVNSIKMRTQQVLHWLNENNIDVLALQEIKCRTDAFPSAAFERYSYHSAVHGLGGREGVAIISRSMPRNITTYIKEVPVYIDPTPMPTPRDENSLLSLLSFSDPVCPSQNNAEQSKTERNIQHPTPAMQLYNSSVTPQARVIAADVMGIRVYSVYIPNGRDVSNPHYLYKLDWLKGFTAHIREALKNKQPLLIAGDFNIVFLDRDSGDPNIQTDADIFRTPSERQAFTSLLDLGLQDLVRPFVPEGFTFWDYRGGRFQKNEGLRIDHILGTADIAHSVKSAKIDREQRNSYEGAKPSDHAPVMIELTL